MFCDYLGKFEHVDLPSPHQFELESKYRNAELGSLFKELSFCVVRQGRPEAFVIANKIGDAVSLSSGGLKIVLMADDKKIITAIFNHLMVLAKKNQCVEIKVEESDVEHTLSPIGQEAFNRQGTSELKLNASQDLLKPERELYSEIRKSYRNLINQGKQKITFSFMTSQNADRDIFDDFKRFHFETSGRQTRPAESWDVQFDMIKSGCAELILGHMETHGLVSSALFTDYGSTTAYAVAVYERSLFEFPLAHANVYEGLLRAKARNQMIFNFGVIPTYDSQSIKEYNIGKFKKGFCRTLSISIEWRLSVS